MRKNASVHRLQTTADERSRAWRAEGPRAGAGCPAYRRCVARYRLVEEAESAVSIEVTEVAGMRDELLDAFAACQAGQCSCPTDEYEKLDYMDIETGEDEIRLRLAPRAGEKFDVAEIGACLDYTTSKATKAAG